MRGPLVIVACACGAVTALLAPPPALAFQQLPWGRPTIWAPEARGRPATSIAQPQHHRPAAAARITTAQRGGGGSSCGGGTQLHATLPFGLEGLLKPASSSSSSNVDRGQEGRRNQQQQSEVDEAAARAKERLERGVNRLAVTFGWCLSPADQQFLHEAWTELSPSLAHLSEAERALVEAALEVAYHAHLGQRRKSGEPYIVHPVAVAQLVAWMGLDGETVAAALLHDTVEDTNLRAGDIEACFGAAVRQLVEGETKVSKLPRQLVKAFEAGLSDKAAANLCHLIMAMARDWRVVVIKLADRLHNCRTLGFMPPAKQVSVAQETLAVYVPLAERLGLSSVKAELEDLAFQHLHPLERATIVAAIARRRALLASLHTNRFGGARMTMDAALTEALPRLLVARGSLKGHRVRAVLEGASPLEVFQRWARAEGKGKGRGPEAGSPLSLSLLEGGLLDGEPDLLTLKVVVSSASASASDAEADHALCTRVLEALEADVHATPEPGARREDYVRFPKANGYQALHAVLRMPGLPYPLRVCVQTEEMERVARHGLLALYAPKASASASVSMESSTAVPLQLPWLEAISARTERAVLRDPSLTAAQLIESLQKELTVTQREWAEAAQRAAAEGGRGRGPNAGDVLDFMVRSAITAPEEQEAAGAAAATGAAATGRQEAPVGGQQRLHSGRACEPHFWQTPLYLWPWCLIGNDDLVFSSFAASTRPAGRGEQGRRRQLQRQARGAVTAQRPQGVFDSGELQWFREAEQRHGRLALAVLAWWALQLATDWADAASTTALAAAELADILEGGGGSGAGAATVDAGVLLQALLASRLPALPALSPGLLAVVGAGELIGAVLPNTLEVNKRWQEARRQRQARRQRRRFERVEDEAEEGEDDDEEASAAADARAAMAATAQAARSKQRQAAVGFIPLVGGSASGSSGGVGGALLQLEAPWGLVRAFEALVKAEKTMGRMAMATVLLLLALLM